jgi:fucose permease
MLCFLYGGVEYSVAFWSTSVMLESRGMGLEAAGMYPAMFYMCLMAGRMGFGFFANKLSDTGMIRLGFSIALAGLLILILTSNIVGMALTGLGFAPVFPSIVHDTSNRFNPKLLTKLVGYEIAALGAGVAIVSSLKGQLLSRVSLELLFPSAIAIVVLILLLNEFLEKKAQRDRS